MKQFNQFNIKPSAKGFEGDKIKMAKILNREIVVHDFRLEASKIFTEKGTRKCLHLQISINEVKYIIFTSSGGLIEAILQVPVTEFPFITTIVEENDRFIFT